MPKAAERLDRHTLRLPIRPESIVLAQAPNSNGGTGFATANSVITSVMPTPAIFVESLEKYFPPALSGWRSLLQPVARPTEKALAGISFSVQPAEAVAIIGPNGAGKSTLLRVLATLIIPTRGRASIVGCDVERDASRARCLFGYHTGDEGFYARLSGRENLALFAAMNNISGTEARIRIKWAAERMGICGELDRQVRTFSTGTTHRLGLARALLHRPAVLLLDEPTRSLDPLAAADFRRLLKQDLVRQHGTTLLFASHTLSEVEEIADRVILLEEGRIAAFDSARALCAATAAQSFEEAISRLARHVVAADARP
ncbi:MAG: ABC transporter ATP-binding protein [Candidatus Acidiferrales bacterium]